MFVAAALAFCAGVYFEAVCSLPLAPLLSAVVLGLALTGMLLHRSGRVGRLSAFLILLCFALAGASRLAMLQARLAATDVERGDAVYEGVVKESSPNVKVLSLLAPAELGGMEVAYLSDRPLETGQTVRVFGRLSDLTPSFNNPGTTSWRRLKRLEGVAYRLKGDILSTAAANDPVSSFRRYFKRNIERSGARRVDVLKALAIGDRSAVPRETNQLFMETGTSHLLAVSGFNVGIVSGFFFFLVRWIMRRSRRLRLSGRDSRYAAALTLPFPFLFMLVAGGGVSVIRATIMVSIFLLAAIMERQRHVYNTMALACLVILLVYPHSLITASFQLTFVSLASICLVAQRLYPLLAKVKNRAISWSASTLLSTAAATIGTAPIVIYYFCGINPFCLVHNIVAIPTLGVAATTCSLAGMVAPVASPLLVLAGHIVDLAIAALRLLDFGYLYPVIRPNLADTLLYYALLVAVLHVSRKPVAALLCCIIVPLSIMQAHRDFRMRFNDDLKVHFIDVGAGDAALVEAPGGLRILIDGGGYQGSDFDVGARVIAPFLLHRKVVHLDYVINTHPHADHAAGLRHVLDRFRVSHLVTAGCVAVDGDSSGLTAIARSKGIDHMRWKKGDRMKATGIAIDVLSPALSTPAAGPNDASLVLRLIHGNVSILFAGDIQKDVEEELVLSGDLLRSSILKVPHHGSASSSSLAFISAVRPEMAVLSCSDSMRGLPAREALERYESLSVPVQRTDRDGLVEVRSNGRRITALSGGQCFGIRGSPRMQ